MAVEELDVVNLLGGPSETGGLSLVPYLATAQLVVAEDLAEVTLTEDRKDQITLYMAAHFATLVIEKGGLIRDEMGESEQEYRRIPAGVLGYNATRFGQQALALDTSGILAANGSATHKAIFQSI